MRSGSSHGDAKGIAYDLAGYGPLLQSEPSGHRRAMETSLPSTGPALDVAVGAAAPSPTSSLVQRALQGAAGVIPGLLPATVLGLAAYGIGKLVPEVGGPVIAVLAGIGVAAAAGHRPSWVQGIRFGTHQLLKTAIVLLGFGLSL